MLVTKITKWMEQITSEMKWYPRRFWKTSTNWKSSFGQNDETERLPLGKITEHTPTYIL
jgi:hypothetical protein